MTNSCRKISATVGLTTLLCAQATAQGRLDGKWHAELCPRNPDYVEAKIDVSSLDGIASDVSFDVIFFDKNKHRIEKRSFRFTDVNLRELTRDDRVQVRYFPHDVRLARSAKGTELHYTIHTRGQLSSIPKSVDITALHEEPQIPFLLQVLGRLFRFLSAHTTRKQLIIDPVPPKKKVRD